jgi:hypothetical protein
MKERSIGILYLFMRERARESHQNENAFSGEAVQEKNLVRVDSRE